MKPILPVADVIGCADSARRNGHTYLARELLSLAEEMLAHVDHESTALGRLAIEAIEQRMPAHVADATWLRIDTLSGGNR